MKTCLHAILFLFVLFSCQYVAARDKIKFPSQNSLVFVENAGQIANQHYSPRNDIDYKLNAPGMDIFIGDGQIHYQFLNRDLGGLKDGRDEENKKVEVYRLDVSLIGANKHAKVIAEDKQAYYERYYLDYMGQDGAVAYSYKKITYREIYPHIDWVLYVNNNELKYDFVVRPGGKVSDIQLKYEGATSLRIQNGALTVVTPFGSITEQQPYSYEAGSKKEITSRYVLQDNVLSFETADFAGTLVIDPTLQWGTYYGGSGDEFCMAVATDPGANVYICGYTSSTNNIATAGSFQSTTITTAGFLAKLNSLGQRLWGTYFVANGWGVACDGNGMVYIAADAASGSNLVTPGSHQPVNAGSEDAVLAQFDGNGQRIWGTYYGGGTYDWGAKVAADPWNNIYFAGYTQSATGIASPGSHQPLHGGGVTDNFLAKFTNTGQRLWGTYYGGAGFEGQILNYEIGLATSPNGDVYLGGTTSSNNGIATLGAFQTINAGNDDHYLVRFNRNGQRIWGTYYGGTDEEREMNLAADVSGNVYISGLTESSSGIATPGAYQTVYAGNGDGYIAKFNPSGQREWGTYYGGVGGEWVMGIAFDAARNIYIGGGTGSTGLATPGAYQTILSGGRDAFLAKLSPSGQRLWASYYGGNAGEGLETGMASDSTGSIYITSTTASTNGISTPGSHQPGLGGGGGDAYLAKFRNEDTLVYIKAIFGDTLVCPLDTLHVPYGLTYNFRNNNTFTLQLSDAAGNFTSPVNIGTAATNAAGWMTGVIPVGTPAGNDYRIRIVASGPADTSLWRSIRIKPRPAKPTATSNTPVCVGNSINLSGSSTTTGVSYSWTGPGSYSSGVQFPVRNNATLAMAGNYILKTTLNGCTSEADTAAVVVNANPPAPVAGSNSPICAGTALNLTATPVSGTYSWNGPGSFSSGLQNPTINPAAASAAGTYTVNVTNANGCVSANGTVNVVINTSTAPTVGLFPNPNDSVCPGALVTFVAVPNNGGTPSYRWFKNTLLIAGATAPTYQTSTISTGDFYSVEMTSTQPCAVPATVNSSNVIMTVVPPVVPSVTITASPGLNVGPWRMITFTATPVNGGPSPTYQWLRNGQPVIGAISNTWGAANLSDNDVISVVLISSEVCAIPPTDTSNVLTVHINMGVDDEDNNTPNLQLYPNPNNGEFIIRGNINSKEVLLEVFNSIGQMVHSERIEQENNELDHGLQLEVASGVYMLRVSTDEGVEVMRFRVE